VRPTKTLGQNFVIDPNTIRKVLEVARLSPEDTVLEIGAGAGSLTLGLAAAARHVVAVEVDPRLIEVLGETLAGVDNIEVVAGDAMSVPLGEVRATKLVANLPYNIAVPVVMRVLEEAPQVDELVVMTQREVGERLVAGPGSKTYGQVSVLVAYFGGATLAAKISRRAFWPVPNVDSVLVRIIRDERSDVSRRVLFPLVKAAFAQRRKTLRNNLSPPAGRTAEEVLAAAGVDPGTRAEQLTLGDFVAIAKEMAP
jgi:16S rRNA (adenine1518-N6/adenine1519-N6)-dimethyltransferase